MFKKVRARYWSTIMIIFLFVILSTTSIAAQNTKHMLHAVKDTILVASEPSYPPFCIVDEDGNADGFSVDLIKAAAEVMHLNIKFKVGPWAEIKQELVEGKIDALPLVGRSPEREAVYDFTFPYHIMNGAVFVRKGTKGIETLGDLKHRDIAVMKGDNAHEFVARVKLSDKIHTTLTYDVAFQELSEGKYDAVIAQQLMGLQLLNELNIQNVQALDIELTDFNQDFSFAVQEGNKELLAVLNEGLSIIVANGTYDELHKKWWSPITISGLSTKEKITMLLPYIISIIFIIAIIAIVVLEIRVKRRTRKLRKEIAVRKQTEIALKESEEKYRNIFENVLDMFFEVRLDGEIIDVSPSIQELSYGQYKRDDLIGRSMYDLYADPAMREVFLEALQKQGSVADYEIIFKNRDGSEVPCSISARIQCDAQGTPTKIIGSMRNITERKRAEEELKKIEWLLEKEKKESSKIAKNYIPDYGDVTKLNTERTILDNVGADTLKTLCSDIMDLLDTSIAIYEKNGDYAYGQFDSRWCQTMDIASFRLCKTQDNKEALSCGKWLCHENCWNDSAKEAIITQKTTDIECVGGIHLYAVPIFAGRELVGVINMGYGNPPTEEKNLIELAEKFHVEYEVLDENATNYRARPPFIIENAKKRLQTVAQLIGKIVDSAEKEKQIKESEDFLNRTGEISRVGGWQLADNFTRVEWTKTTGDIHELSEGVYPTLEDAINYYHPDDRDKVNKSVSDAIEKGKPFDFQTRLITAKGNLRWVRAIGCPEMKNGKCVRLSGTFQDITEHKQAEEKLEAAKEKAEESEARLRDAQRIANIGNWSLDLQTGRVEMSDEMLNLNGLKDKNEALDVANHEKFYTPESWLRFEKAVETCRNTGKSYEIIMEFSDKNAEFRYAVARGEAINDENNNIIGLKGTLQDITQRKRAEEELKINRERLKTASSILRHDITNDLTVIKSAVDIYREERDESMIDEIEKRVWKSIETIQNQRDQVQFLDSHADLDEYELKEVVQKVLSNYPDLKITVTGNCVTYADNAIYSVFDNIVNNAVKHGKTSKLDIEIIPNKEHCEIKFKDYGIGIPDEIKDKVFDEGFHYGETGHTGIGLYIVQTTVEEYGGEVFVEDNEPNGAIFIIRLKKAIEV